MEVRVVGYQTIKDKGDPGDIENHGPYKCTRDDAWLGFGYYFWDSRIDWGHWWGSKSYNGNYIICKAEIILGKTCFDLVGNVIHQQDFLETFEVLNTKHSKAFKHNNVTVPQVIEYLKRKGFLKQFETIRSHHHDRDLTKAFYKLGEEFLFLGHKVQICLIQINELALQTYKIVFPDEYVDD